MLGFSVHVTNEAGTRIGFWVDDGKVYSSLKDMVDLDQAKVVEENGGYPNIYVVQYKFLDLLFRRGIRPKTSGFKIDTNHSYKDRDSWVSIELWDQS